MSKNPNITDSHTIPEEAYVTWDDNIDNKKQALSKSSESLDEFVGIQRAEAVNRYRLDYSNLDTNTSGRPGLTRTDYDFFRPDEAVPTKIKNILKKAEDIYQRVGLVKNVIDLMADFAVQGIRPVHRNKRIERFYRAWFKKVAGKDRSERLLNNIYKTGNVVINKQTGKINIKNTNEFYKATADADIDSSEMLNNSFSKKEIPWKYTFIDPFYVEVSGGSLSSFVNHKTYELKLPSSLRKMINAPKNQSEQKIVDNLPKNILEAAQSKKSHPLNPDKTSVYHYKKDDWQSWAYPMIYAIMDDILIIEKLKLADIAALDGAISNIRIFKLGNLDHKIAPTKAATSRLAQILGNNVGGGTMDLVWGPDIELIESKTNVHQFLGEEKYKPHLNSIYAGLGIPPTLTGTFGAAGTTNNFISLKTLTQRLQYGRDILIDFWEKEMASVQKAMGFRYSAKIEFDRMDLSNEDSEKALLIQLADRNLISDEMLQTRFGFDFDMERIRLNRESKDRKSERMVNKSGPWHDPQLEHALKKIALQTGIVTPSQIGLTLDTKKNNEKTSLEMRNSMVNKKQPTQLGKDSETSLPGVPGAGRPKNSKDSNKRKTKDFSPQTGAGLTIWANNAQDKISEIVNPIVLEYFQKKNLRSLSNEQTQELDKIKTHILFCIKPYASVSDNLIRELLQHDLQNIKKNVYIAYNQWQNYLTTTLGRVLTSEDQKYARSSFYSFINSPTTE